MRLNSHCTCSGVNPCIVVWDSPFSVEAVATEGFLRVCTTYETSRPDDAALCLQPALVRPPPKPALPLPRLFQPPQTFRLSGSAHSTLILRAQSFHSDHTWVYLLANGKFVGMSHSRGSCTFIFMVSSSHHPLVVLLLLNHVKDPIKRGQWV